MTDPSYRDNAAPPPPPGPPTFSPLRPFKRTVWWCLSELVFAPREHSDIMGALGPLFLIWAVAVLIAGLVAFSMPTSTMAEQTAPPARQVAQAILAVLVALPAARSWIISAMHLDNPESRAWWEARFR